VKLVRKSNPVEDAFATATVLAWRLPMLWAMAFDPTPRRRAEALRMITEKSAAAADAPGRRASRDDAVLPEAVTRGDEQE
jgi:hypothetical protein